MKTSVKTIGDNGQISLGKEHAGKVVLVEEERAGVWRVRVATVIPDDELSLHGEDLRRAIRWAEENPPKESDPDEIGREIERRRGQ